MELVRDIQPHVGKLIVLKIVVDEPLPLHADARLELSKCRFLVADFGNGSAKLENGLVEIPIAEKENNDDSNGDRDVTD